MASTGAPQQDARMVATSPPLPSYSELVKRCVIIQKDERGYGFRVSGDNPVFVEFVRADGAAWRAGVRAGNRIIKVNGTLVTKHGHGDVVKIIQNYDSCVGLTLLGFKTSPIATSDTASVTAAATPPQQITAPLPPLEHTQQEYEASRVATIQELPKHERQYTTSPLPQNHTSEKKIQVHNDIMREIIDSEERHMEVLTFIIDVFYRPLRTEQLIPKDQFSLIFSNTKKLLRLHAKIFKMLSSYTSQNKTFEQILFDIFCGDLGIRLEKETSVFCANQKTGGIDTWRARRKDSKIKSIILEPAKELENPLARLSLEDHFVSVFLRPFRYQLLIQRLFDQTPVYSEEFKLLQRALARIKEIGSIVNEATRRAELRQRLLEIQKKIDCAQSTTLDLKGHCLVHEGSLTWRINKQKNVDVWLLLTDKLLVILERDGDRLVLKHHTNPHTRTQHSPILLLHDLLTHDVATDSTAFFLVSYEQYFIYEFAASTPKDRNAWKEAIANATMTYNG